MPEASGFISDRVRSACEWVAGRARSVRIEEGKVAAYASGLPSPAGRPSPDPATELAEGVREAGIAFVLCLDAINFGSGWWPTIRKRRGRSGYFTIAAGLTERFRESGPWLAAELVGADHDGRFEAVVEAARGSAPALAGLLAEWRAFADVSTYEDRPVPFFKRAQIAAADIDRMGLAELSDLDRLTAFADNLVPHVLRVDGVLRLDPALEARIEAGELLEHDSAEEVELRACTVQAIELLAAASPLTPAEIDAVLWNRGAAERYKSLPRPRSRTTAY